MERGDIVFTEAKKLYAVASTSMGTWMWHNHVQWVADKAKKLAEKYDADVEKVYCAALLHDLGDSRYERGHPEFEPWSWEESKAILKRAGFRHAARKEILEAISTHSCHPGHLPATVEGKVLATADAMWHLQTNFFPVICYMHRPESTHSYEEWQGWFRQKVERDYGSKIFFDDEREEVQEDYNALIRVFGARSLDGKATTQT